MNNTKKKLIASICHEVNKAYCEYLGDVSQVPWEDAPLFQKESILNGVLFHIDNPLAGPEGSHENWMAEKLAAGWKWGPVKDVVKKEHPNLVPYKTLPPEQRLKDSLFVAIVRATMKLEAIARQEATRKI
jgi:hypothetical protein